MDRHGLPLMARLLPALLAGGLSAARAETLPPPAAPSAARAVLSSGEIVARVRPAFVTVAGGSGAVISPDGEIITNNHVVENLAETAVTLGTGQTFRARVIGRDRQGDLALLKIPGASGMAFLPLGHSAGLRRGERCYVAGSPAVLGWGGPQLAFSAGVVSALHQFRQGYNDAIVVDAAVNPGNSGGPLVNARAELIGVCGMTQTRLGLKSNTGVAFAIPVDQLRLWLPFLRRANGGNVFHGRLDGLELAEDNGSVSVKGVLPGSPAAAAGFRPGDAIQSFMGYHIPTVARFDSVSGIYPAGGSLQAVVRRAAADGRTVEKNLYFSLPPLRPWKVCFTVAPAGVGDEFPRIAEVRAGGAAARAGARAGDEILAVNNLPVSAGGLSQLQNYLDGIHAGDIVALRLRRGGEKLLAEFRAE